MEIRLAPERKTTIFRSAKQPILRVLNVGPSMVYLCEVVRSVRLEPFQDRSVPDPNFAAIWRKLLPSALIVRIDSRSTITVGCTNLWPFVCAFRIPALHCSRIKRTNLCGWS